MAFDTLIVNATVIDGTNTPRYKGDVGIANGRIEAIGQLGDAEAARLAPQDITVLGDYARAVLTAAGEATEFPAEAKSLYRRIEGLNPEQPEALWFLGFAEAAAGNNGGARNYWNRLLDLLPAGHPDSQAVEQALYSLQQ